MPPYLSNFLNKGFKLNSEQTTDKKALDSIKYPYWISLSTTFFVGPLLIEFPLRRKLFLDETQQRVLHNKDGLNESNYAQRFRFLLWIEEHQMNKDIHNYDQKDAILGRDPHQTIYYTLQVYFSATFT